MTGDNVQTRVLVSTASFTAAQHLLIEKGLTVDARPFLEGQVEVRVNRHEYRAFKQVLDTVRPDPGAQQSDVPLLAKSDDPPSKAEPIDITGARVILGGGASVVMVGAIEIRIQRNEDGVCVKLAAAGSNEDGESVLSKCSATFCEALEFVVQSSDRSNATAAAQP